jgi:hypothetical protein
MVLVESIGDGIVKVRQNNEEYIVWTRAKVVIPYIRKFLRETFPGKLVVRELNRIDFSVPEESLPIEVQATLVSHPNTRYAAIHYAQWENNIRNQFEKNIVPYGRCWFFFDQEMLRSMKNAGRGISVNMDWFRKLMKDGVLKAFTVSYNGIIEEKSYKDFDFLSEMSQTCTVSAETDDAILNKNKMKIFTNVVKGYGFTQEDIFKIEGEYEKYCDINKIEDVKNDRIRLFLKRQIDEKSKLYANILEAIGNLPAVNQLLDRNAQKLKKRHMDSTKVNARILGIFDTEGHTQRCITRFMDKFDICKHSQGFLRHEKTWTKLKGHKLNNRQFDNIIKDSNNGITIDNYFWYEEDKDDAVTESGQISDKGVNVITEDNDQIITINIKDKSVQRDIESAWGSA